MEQEKIKAPFVWIKEGTFHYGEDHDNWRGIPEWEHRIDKKTGVTVRPFLLGTWPVTFGEYDEFCKDTNRPLVKEDSPDRAKLPIFNISWLEATHYCNWRSRKDGLPEAYVEEGKKNISLVVNYDIPIPKSQYASVAPKIPSNTKKGNVYCGSGPFLDPDIIVRVEGYRLPTDIEWEYAAKGGPSPFKQYIYIGSDNVNDTAWFKENSNYAPHPVCTKKPNALGLYDMAGNVYEYCTDGRNDIRFLRGGGWSSKAESMRATFRNGCRIDEEHSYVGFRIARSWTQIKQPHT